MNEVRVKPTLSISDVGSGEDTAAVLRGLSPMDQRIRMDRFHVQNQVREDLDAAAKRRLETAE